MEIFEGLVNAILEEASRRRSGLDSSEVVLVDDNDVLSPLYIDVGAT